MATRRTAAPSPPKTRNVPPWKERNLKHVASTTAWIHRLAEDWARANMPTDDLASMSTYLDGVRADLEALPDDWKPPARSNGALNVGDPVQLLAEATNSYAFIRDIATRMNGAVVAGVFDKKTVVVRLNDGEQTLIQKAHLARTF